MAAEAWTDDQRRAVALRGGDLLVSAGAGAGKTAVLVERVLRRILDPAEPSDLDRLLVVTFTEAAAAELRSRIGRALEQAVADRPGDQRPRRQLSLLPRASISTLHAFCLQTIRQHFFHLDLDPSLRVLGEHEAALLEQEVLEDLFEDRYAAEDAAFLALVDAYGDEALRALTLRLHAAAYCQPLPERWLRELAARFDLPAGTPVEATPWAAPVRGAACRAAARAAADMQQALEVCALPAGPADLAPVLEADRDRLAALARCLPEVPWDEAGPAVAAADTWPTLRGGRGADPDLAREVRDLRQRAKDRVAALGDGIFRPGADLVAELRGFLPLAAGLGDLARAFDGAFTAAKRARGSLDFLDMERQALRLLRRGGGDGGGGEGSEGSEDEVPARPSAVAEELRQRFDEVLVDEYQDVNALQDAVLSLVGAEGRRFRVGDVKQSIYRFRQAEPELFLGHLRRAAPAGPDGAAAGGGPGSGQGPAPATRLDLRHNFRSRPPVIDTVNFVFRQVMTPALGGLPYDAAAELVAAARYPTQGADPPVEVHLIERASADGDPADTTALEREAALVGRRIRDLVAEAPEVWDPAEGRARPLRWRDVVVLLRAARTQMPVFAAALEALGVPVHARTAGGFFAAMEVEVVLALLQIIDNPLHDIALAAVLRSPLVGLSPDDLARVRLAAPGSDYLEAVRAAAGGDGALADRLSRFLADLDRWRTAARRGTISRLIDGIYAETGWLGHVSFLPGGEQRRANLLALADRARQFDGFARQGLFRFLRFVERLRDRGDDLGPPPRAGERDDVVRLMTIHQSKGLEFPVAVLANLGGPFSFDAGDVLLDRGLGLGPVLVDPEARAAHPSLAHRAVREQARREDLAEEVRALYVAMTRARERLLLFGSARNLPRAARRWLAEARRADGAALPEAVLAEAGCFLDWLGPALARHPDGGALRRLAASEVSPPPGSPEADPARWEVHVWAAEAASGSAAGAAGPSAGLAAGPAGHEAAPSPAPAPPEAVWTRVLAGAPPDAASAPSPLGEELAARILWRHPRRPLADRLAKRAVTELRARPDPLAGEAPAPADLRAGLPPRPRFLRPPGQGLDGAAAGTATHAVLQHLDLGRPLDEADIAAQMEAMVAAEHLTAEQVDAVPIPPLARFFASPLGGRLRAGRAAARREWMFSLALPAARVHPDLPAEAAAGELVLVQGVVDCLVEEDRGCWLIDFKTDRLRGRPAEEAAEDYRPQVELYGEAVEAILGKPARELYVCFLAAGVSVALRDGARR